jgi:hypothetical protein
MVGVDLLCTLRHRCRCGRAAYSCWRRRPCPCDPAHPRHNRSSRCPALDPWPRFGLASRHARRSRHWILVRARRIRDDRCRSRDRAATPAVVRLKPHLQDGAALQWPDRTVPVHSGSTATIRGPCRRSRSSVTTGSRLDPQLTEPPPSAPRGPYEVIAASLRDQIKPTFVPTDPHAITVFGAAADVVRPSEMWRNAVERTIGQLLRLMGSTSSSTQHQSARALTCFASCCFAMPNCAPGR